MFKRLRAFEAPHSYVFVDPDTGYKYHTHNQESLVKSIITYRHQNRLPNIEALNAVLENYWCGLPENNGKCQDNKNITRSWSAYIKGGVALLQNLAYRKYASQETADTRSEQCAKCPNNTFPDKGPFIKWSDEIAIQCVGERRSKEHLNIGSCGVCSCPLRAKVFWDSPLPPFPEDQLVELKKVKCWQLKLSNQDK